MALVHHSDSGLNVEVGDRLTRSQLNERFGGGIQGGILTPAGGRYIFLFSDPKAGSLYGYDFDGWESYSHKTFFYTGGGSEGPQTLTHRNKTLFESQATGREIHLFLAVDTRAGSQEKIHEYLGQFTLDKAAPYRVETGLDADRKELRTVLVFRLDRYETEQLSERAGRSIASSIASSTGARPVSREASHILTYTRTGVENNTGSRRERVLEDKLIDWLEEKGKVASRLEIRIEGQSGRLYTDTWVNDDRELFEVKGDATRNDVRMAVAQLLDYSRHIYPPPNRATVVLPSHPGADLAGFIESCGLQLAVMTDSGLLRTSSD
jgi:hypothetical protein